MSRKTLREARSVVSLVPQYDVDNCVMTESRFTQAWHRREVKKKKKLTEMTEETVTRKEGINSSPSKKNMTKKQHLELDMP